MSVGDVIGEAWGLYKAHFRHLVSIAFAVYVLIALLTLVLILLLGNFGAFISVFIGVAGVMWLQGALVIAVDDVRDGRADLGIRQTLEHVRPRLNALSLAALVILVAIVVASLLIYLGLLLLIVPGLVLLVAFTYFFVRWVLLVPVIMLEGRNIFGALGRSSQLIRGHWWSAFGVILLTILILIGVGIAINIVLSPLPNSLQGFIAQLVSSTLTAPFAVLAWTLMYFRLRGTPEPALAAAA